MIWVHSWRPRPSELLFFVRSFVCLFLRLPLRVFGETSVLSSGAILLGEKGRFFSQFLLRRQAGYFKDLSPPERHR